MVYYPKGNTFHSHKAYNAKGDVFITNQERIKRRIERDKRRRLDKIREKHPDCVDYDSIFTYTHFIEALQKCRKGVSWKRSVQDYLNNPVIEIVKAVDSLEDCELPYFSSNKVVYIYERGKKRTITPVTMKDRVIQRVLCDYSLVPVLLDSLIYDNGASMPGKGIDFARQRAKKFMKDAIKKYGSDFYILTFDFKSFFDSIPHKLCKDVLDKHFEDKRIVDITMQIIYSYKIAQLKRNIQDKEELQAEIAKVERNEGRGLCLGSQVSQILALATPSKLDHFIKDNAGMKEYERYMDDGFVISKSKEELLALLEKMKAIADELGLTFNEKKTKIVSAREGFTFLKVRHFVGKDGKLALTLHKSSIVRMRRKLKRLFGLYEQGKIKVEDAYNSMQSWMAHARVAMSYHARRNMCALYDKLFGGYRITRRYLKQKRKEKEDALLQNRERQNGSRCGNINGVREIPT